MNLDKDQLQALVAVLVSIFMSNFAFFAHLAWSMFKRLNTIDKIREDLDKAWEKLRSMESKGSDK